MKHLLRRSTTAAFVAAAVAALVVPGGTAYAGGLACPGPGTCVIVDVVNGSGQTVATATYGATDLQTLSDLGSIDYPVRTAVGTTPPDVIGSDAASVAKLIDSTPLTDGTGNASADQVTYVQILSSAGQLRSTLGPGEYGPGPSNDFVDGYSPALFFSSTDVDYVRPLRSATDANQPDTVVQQSGPIEILAHTSGQLLDVSVTPQSASVAAGKPLRMAASVSGGTGPYTYSWDFVGQTTSPAPAPTASAVHPVWSGAGTYYVSVTAHDPATGDYGQSAYVPVTVGKAPPPTGNKPGSGHRHHHHPPPSGPVNGGGHHAPKGHGHHEAPTPSTSPTASGASAPGTTGHESSRAGTRSSAGRHRGRTRATTRGGRTVTGRLLLTAQTYAVASPEAATKASGSHTPPQVHWSWPWRWTAILLLPALFLLGMVGEGVQVRRRVARMTA